MIEKEVKIKLKKGEIKNIERILAKTFEKGKKRSESYLVCPLKNGYLRMKHEEYEKYPGITIKSSRKNGKYNIREENSFSVEECVKTHTLSWGDVSDPEEILPGFDIKKFFPALCRASGVEKPIEVKRERTTYSNSEKGCGLCIDAQNGFVCLDKLANGDSYLEIECEREKDIETILKKLNLQNRKIETRPYYELMK